MLLGCARQRTVTVSGKNNVHEKTKMGFYECVFLLQTLYSPPQDQGSGCGLW